MGRKVGRTIYAQEQAEPTDDDMLIGVMDTRELAAEAVTAHNGTLDDSREAVEPELQQVVARYRRALQQIVDNPKPWCRMYAECDHEGCEASHRAVEIAEEALDLFGAGPG